MTLLWLYIALYTNGAEVLLQSIIMNLKSATFYRTQESYNKDLHGGMGI